VTRECVPCESPCKTCSGSLNTCTSCDQAHPQYLIFDNKCYEECPEKVSVFSQGQCLHCSDNCKTCQDTFDTCTTCYGEDFLNKLNQRCVESCTAEIMVASQAFPPSDLDAVALGDFQSLTCELCHENCLTCDPFNTNVCTECRDGLKMIEKTKACAAECPSKTAEMWIPLTQDTVCARCLDGCAECMYSRDHCTVCEEGFFLY
jgi:proprotein convertase subtilisin/kexin type 5